MPREWITDLLNESTELAGLRSHEVLVSDVRVDLT